RSRAIVSACRVAVLEVKPEQHLGQVVPARGELIEDLLGRGELLLLEAIHLAAGQNQPRDLAPVHFCGHLARVALSHGQAPSASTTAAINRSICASLMPTTLKRPLSAM